MIRSETVWLQHAVCMKRFDFNKSRDREGQRTMLELLNQRQQDQGLSVILTWSTDADRVLCVDPYPVNCYTIWVIYIT